MNKEKLKKQNSSRITEPENGLTVTKGKRTGEDGWEGRDKRGERGISSTYDVEQGTWGRWYDTEKTSSDSIASYYTDGQ